MWSKRQQGDHAGEHSGCDMAKRGVVVLAVVDHQAAVVGCESGVEAAGLIGAHKSAIVTAPSPDNLRIHRTFMGPCSASGPGLAAASSSRSACCGGHDHVAAGLYDWARQSGAQQRRDDLADAVLIELGAVGGEEQMVH